VEHHQIGISQAKREPLRIHDRRHGPFLTRRREGSRLPGVRQAQRLLTGARLLAPTMNEETPNLGQFGGFFPAGVGISLFFPIGNFLQGQLV
jgi:hypothetical protein